MICCSIFLASPAFPAVVYVDSQATGPIYDGSSWQNAYKTITAALNSISTGGSVWVREGTYPERITLTSYQNVYGGFLGYEISIDQRMPGAFQTVIDARKAGRCIDVSTGAWAVIDGFTIKNGRADKGAGIRCCINSNVKIRNCRIENCEATQLGGGVYHDKYSTGEMTDSTITGCGAPNGGGLVVEYHAYPIHQRCEISHNWASTSGGGLYCPFHSEARMENCTFVYDTAVLNGGAAYTYRGGPVAFDHCILAYNSAPDTGGVYGDGGSSTTIFTCCDFYANENGDWGGAIEAMPADYANTFVDPMFLMPERDVFCLSSDSCCSGMGAYSIGPSYQLRKIGDAKMLPLGSAVTLTGKVISCSDGDMVWIEETDRSATIPISGITGCSPENVLMSVTGALSTGADGMILLQASSWTLASGADYELEPFGTCISRLDSASGFRVKTWGRVTGIDSDGFTLSDADYSVNVIWPGEQPQVGSFLVVTGGYTGLHRFQATKIE